MTDTHEILGTVEAMGSWGTEDHSRDVRRQINALVATGDLNLVRGKPPVTQWLAAVKQAALHKTKGSKANVTTKEASQIAEELRKRGPDLLENDETQEALVSLYVNPPDQYRGPPLPVATEVMAIN